MTTDLDGSRAMRINGALSRATVALAGVGSLRERLERLDSVTLLTAAIGSAEILAVLLVEDERRFGVE